MRTFGSWSIHGPRTYARILHNRQWDELLHEKSWEPSVFKTAQRIKGRLFVDVGANIGQYTIPLAKNFETVIVFEPDARYANRLIRELVRHRVRNVKVRKLAVSNKDDVDVFYYATKSERVKMGSLLPEFRHSPTGQTIRGGPGETVSCVRLDTVLAGEDVDLLKVDVEGAEFLVLQGATNLLSQGRVRHMIVELHNWEFRKSLEKLADDYGFVWNWIDSSHLFGVVART